MPPATEPRKYRILEDVRTALQLPDGGADYFYSVGINQVADGIITAEDAQSKPKPFIGIADYGSNRLHGDEAGGLTYVTEEMAIQIMAYLGDTSDARRDLSRLEGDIRRALAVDPQRSGLAQYTLWQETTPLDVEDMEPHIVIVFTVQYEIKESDLTSNIP